jgi:hypothetical protein
MKTIILRSPRFNAVRITAPRMWALKINEPSVSDPQHPDYLGRVLDLELTTDADLTAEEVERIAGAVLEIVGHATREEREESSERTREALPATLWHIPTGPFDLGGFRL